MDQARICIVEDNRIVAEDIKQTLIDIGYQVTGIATNSKKALAILETNQTDLALMDINLGKGMDGIELAGILREKYQIPVVYLTAHADKATLDRAKLTQPFGYLIKPFGRQEIQSTLEMALYKCRSDKKIKKSEQWLATTLKCIGDGVIATDAKGKIRYLNPVAETLTGWKSDQALGHALGEVFHIINETTGEPCGNPVETVLKTGKRLKLANGTMLINRQGKKIPIKDSGSPIVLENGETIGVVLVFQDITHRKQAEVQIGLLKKAIDDLAESIIITDADSRIQYVNRAFENTTGYSGPDIIGKTPKMLKSGVHPEEFYRDIWETLARKEPWFGVFTNRKKDGSLFHEKATISPVLDGNSNITHFIAVKRDITKDLIQEKRIRQSQKMESIGTLAGGIAHDFNNILSPILGFAQLSLQSAEEGSILSDNLEEIEKAALRAKDLVRQILTFARHSDENVAPIRIYPIINEALKFIRSSIPTTIEINTRIERTGYVLSDPTKIHQIVMNLCTNAYHAIEKDTGKISVTLEETALEKAMTTAHWTLNPGSYVMLKVSDTGTGIPEKELDTIFEPYFTTKETGEGTGLGLAVCQGAATSMNGGIRVDSELGRGTIFTLYLPVSRDKGRDVSQEREKLPTGNEHILFVDDEISVTKLNKRLLESLGYRVTIENESPKALSLVLTDPDQFDLMITDMTMPAMTGYQLAEEIKVFRPDLPIILCSGFNKKITDQTIVETGINAYCKKPISTAELARTIRRLLDDTDGDQSNQDG